MKNKLLVLVDGSYYLFRAYHVPALQDLKTSDGRPTGAIYGVINMLRKLLNDYKPDYFAVVFDAKGKNFRHDLYKEYKANRPPMPEDLIGQIAPIHNIIHALGLPLLMIDDVEADDVIATLAKNAAHEKINTVISTGDKDLAQLVNKNITLVNTMNNVVLDIQGVKDKFDVKPEQIIDYLTLVGDAVDNVPGVPKVGPKTAAKWLAEYHSLSGVIEHAKNIRGKVGENLRNSLEQLPLSKQLVTLKTDVALDVEPADLTIGDNKPDTLKKEYQYWQLNTWLKDLEENYNGESAGDAEQKAEFAVITTIEELKKWLSRLNQSGLFAFDCETTSLDYMQAEIVGLSFADSARQAAYVPLAHDYPDAPKQLSLQQVLEIMQPVLEDGQKFKVGQNLKYDMSVLARYGIELNGIKHDSMLQSYVYNSTATRHDMDSLALKYLGYTTIHYEDVAGKGSKQIPFNKVAIEQAAPYAAEDAAVTFSLHEYLWPRLQKNKKQKEVYEKIEIPLVSVLSRIERNGVMIDSQLLEQQSKQLQERMQKLEEEIYTLAGEEFNIASPKQIQSVLYEKMDLPILAKTPKGQPSTAESVLQELAQEYDLPRVILDHRSLSKLKSTYTDKLPKQVNPATGRIHTSYHQAVAATGRLSSSDPNLQNIPVRTDDGRAIRRAFIAPEGYRILAADYSQIELRIMAHLSQDKGLLDAFAHGEDIHKITAAEIFDVPIKDIDREQRRAAKAINFGLIYGMSAFGLAKQLGIDRTSAREYVELYFDKYPDVKNFMDQTREFARQNEYVETVYGRRLYLPEINAKNAVRRQYAERTAINAPMQGTAADIIKLAMIRVDNWLKDSKLDARLIMQVHDELVLEVAEDKIDECRNQIADLMVSGSRISVTLDIDMGIGKNWDEAH